MKTSCAASGILLSGNAQSARDSERAGTPSPMRRIPFARSIQQRGGVNLRQSRGYRRVRRLFAIKHAARNRSCECPPAAGVPDCADGSSKAGVSGGDLCTHCTQRIFFICASRACKPGSAASIECYGRVWRSAFVGGCSLLALGACCCGRKPEVPSASGRVDAFRGPTPASQGAVSCYSSNGSRASINSAAESEAVYGLL